MKHGKLVCTGNGTHKPRVLGTYSATETVFAIASLQGDGGASHFPGLQWTRFRCPSCPADLRHRGEALLWYFNLDLPNGASRRDLSLLGSKMILNQRQAD